MKKRFWALLLAVMMVVSVLPTAALAAEDATTTAGYYDTTGAWTQGTMPEEVLPTGIVDVNKTAAATAEPNVYEITLMVETKTSQATVAADAATALVLDHSNSMAAEITLGAGANDLDKLDRTYGGEEGIYTMTFGILGDRPLRFNAQKDRWEYDKLIGGWTPVIGSGYEKYSDSITVSRINAMKIAAKNFVDAYGDATADRWLNVISFGSTANVDLVWTNVSTDAGASAAKNAIDRISTNGGTNLDHGLQIADQQLESDTIESIPTPDNRFVIALTDGVPTYYYYDGRTKGSGQDDPANVQACSNAAINTAKTLKAELNKLYTICFAGGNQTTEILKELASTKDDAYTANTASDLSFIISELGSEINEGTTGEGLVVTDPMAEFITVESAPEAFVSEDGETYEWTLAGAEENGDHYVYTLTYTVEIDADNENVVEGEYYPTNGPTYLTYGDTRVYFPVPGVTCVKTDYTVTYDLDGGESTTTEGIDQNGNYSYTGLHNGDDTPIIAEPTKPGFTFDGWKPTFNATVKGNANYVAKWTADEASVTWIVDGEEVDSQTGVTGDAVEDPDYTIPDGYSFDGWYSDEDCTVEVEIAETMLGDVTYYGKTSADEASVTWIVDDEEVDSQTGVTGDAVEDPDYTVPTGYTFDGWYSDEDCTEKATIAETMFGDITYYGKTSANMYDYTIEYYYDGVIDGTKTVLASAEFGSQITEFDHQYKDNYKFVEVKGLPLTITEIATSNRIQVYYVTKNTDIIVNKDVISVTSPADQPAEIAEEETKWTAKVGDTITWIIKVENKGNVAQTLTLEDILSNGATDVTVVDKDGNAVTTFTLAEGATVEFTATYVVKESDRGLELINTAVIKDGDQKKDEDPAPGVVVEDPKVSITKTADDTSVYVGDKVTYTITVKNEGNVELTGVKVTDTFVDGGTGKLTVKAGNMEIGTLAVGETATIVLEYTTVADDVKGLKNSAVVKTNETEDAASTEDVTVTKKPAPVHPVGPSKPQLNYEDHYAYVVGYPDGLVHPERNITRAEVATIFFRMLLDESREYFWAQENDFSDVAETDWFNNAVSTLANAQLINGYPDGSYRPNANITRAEFATIAIRFFLDEDVEIEENNLSDVKGHWAEANINLAYALELINGYPDGTFRPDQKITRAEAMAIVNRVLKRAPEKDHLLKDMIEWPDNLNTAAWYYADVQEATNSHKFHMDKEEEYEIWTELLPVRDWVALEQEWSKANSSKNPGEVVDIKITTPEAGDNGLKLD